VNLTLYDSLSALCQSSESSEPEPVAWVISVSSMLVALMKVDERVLVIIEAQE
jgi:hypothetical protein